jgi:hypothetical protein
MPAHANFFETLKEAHIRLRGAIVLYDKVPHYVLAITDHKKDGIFRIYLDPIGWDSTKQHIMPAPINLFNAEAPELGEALDKWMDETPSSPVIRKQMNSPLFEKFRPFPLGMVNIGKNCIYTEWQPTRSTYQGLTRGNVTEHFVTLGNQPQKIRSGANYINTQGVEFRDCIVGDYPSAKDCLKNLSSGEYENEAVGFHRNFAFARGPIETLFLVYKTEVIGWLPEADTGKIILGKKFHHMKESVEALGLFASVQLK